MRVNKKFPQWLFSGGTADSDYVGFISNVVYPYFNTSDAPVFKIPYDNKYFPAITYGTEATWLNSLDMLFATRYGDRILMDWIEDIDLHSDALKAITSEQKLNTKKIAQMINLRFAEKWNKIADALAIEYQPLDNYNRIEDSSFETNRDDSFKDSKMFGQHYSDDGKSMVADDRKTTKGIEGGWDDTDGNSHTIENSKQTETWENISGFNSSTSGDAPGEPANYTKTKETYGSGQTPYTESDNGSSSRRYSQANQSTGDKAYKETVEDIGSEASAHLGDGHEDGWRYSETSGNIGVTTSQQMLQSEIDVRSLNMLYDIILKDIADFICLSIY